MRRDLLVDGELGRNDVFVAGEDLGTLIFNVPRTYVSVRSVTTFYH